MTSPIRTVALRGLATAAAAGASAIGGLTLVTAIQVRLTAGQPGEGNVDYFIDGHVGPDDGPPQTVVWLGDSLAAGVGAISAEVSLPRLVASHTGGRTRLHVFATSGARSQDVIEHQLPALELLRHGLAELGRTIDAIAISVGANDVASAAGRRRFRRNLATIIEAAEGLPVVLLSIPQIGDAIRLPHPLRAVASARGSWFNQAVESAARRYDNVEYASVRERPVWISRRHRQYFLSGDRYHPSGAGYAVWADGVAAAFDRLRAVTAGA